MSYELDKVEGFARFIVFFKRKGGTGSRANEIIIDLWNFVVKSSQYETRVYNENEGHNGPE